MAASKSRSSWRRTLRRVEQGAQNAFEVARLGRLSVRRGARFEVVQRDRTFKLRRYVSSADPTGPTLSAPILLVPPLMLTAEIYDVAPELSAVGLLTAAGVDTWVIDFGSPETEEGGMERTLDDHVRAVAACVRAVREATGKDVHLAGYSQGGMFCYQAAAYLRSEGVASLITFGSPVDIHRNIPHVSEELAGRIIRGVMGALEKPLQQIEGLPGVLTSNGFKLISARKEVEQLVDFVSKLHDRQALEKRESRRRFLGGEGFVAWPGPALRTFLDDFVVHNRLASGGFVIDGHTVSMADITCPILAFVGLRDEVARAPAIEAVRKAAPAAEVHFGPLNAGHFGLVVGSAATRDTWPTVVDWLRWREGVGPRPKLLPEVPRAPLVDELEVEDAAFAEPLDFDMFYDTLVDTATSAWKKLGDTSRDLGEVFDNLRWQVPRLTKLERLRDESRISFSLTLSERAAAMPDHTFFLWKGRAFSYLDADTRVSHVVRGFIQCGVQPGQRVGVLMRGRPSHLSVVTALNRIGASAVLLSPDLTGDDLARALAVVPFERLVTDPETADGARAAFRGEVLVLGGGGEERHLAPGVIDMERIDPDAVRLPGWYRPNPGLSRDVAVIIVSCPPGGAPRAARITNGRWAFSALGAAAACTLTPKDTVYCCLPLHHPAGLLVSVGGALAGGSRLALATRFDEEAFWPEVRRYGATVVFYAGTMCRRLVNTPPSASDGVHPLRLFAGSGVRTDVWHRRTERFGPVGVLEFYASTEGNVVLANASGEKVGALGRKLPGSADVAIVRYDFERSALDVDARGHLVRCTTDEPGVLISRIDAAHPAPPADLGPGGAVQAPNVRRDAFERGDAWLVSGDVVRRDSAGDYWMVDRVSDIVRTASGWVSPRFVEDTLYQLPGIGLVSCFGVKAPGSSHEVPAVALVLREGASLDPEALAARVTAKLEPHARPRYVRFVESIQINDGFRLMKGPLRAAGAFAPGLRPTWVYDERRETYAAHGTEALAQPSA